MAVKGTSLLATIPETVSRELVKAHPQLRVTALPFALSGTVAMDLTWRSISGDAAPQRLIREHIIKTAMLRGADKPRHAARARAGSRSRRSR